jgi:carbamate kinase
MKKIVITLGGNAIKQWNQKGSAEEQLENLRGSCSHMMKIIKKGPPIAITHGNRPQEGNLLIQQEKSAREVPPQPLDVCDANPKGRSAT